MGEFPDLGRYRDMLHRLRPTELTIWGCKDENVDAFKGLTVLQSLDLRGCTALQNVDGLKGLTALQTLSLDGCPALKNVNALKSLTSLKTLNFWIGIPGYDEPDPKKCTHIPEATQRELRTALRKTNISFPIFFDHPTQ